MKEGETSLLCMTMAQSRLLIFINGKFVTRGWRKKERSIIKKYLYINGLEILLSLLF
jgi:hypothetical protein